MSVWRFLTSVTYDGIIGFMNGHMTGHIGHMLSHMIGYMIGHMTGHIGHMLSHMIGYMIDL